MTSSSTMDDPKGSQHSSTPSTPLGDYSDQQKKDQQQASSEKETTGSSSVLNLTDNNNNNNEPSSSDETTTKHDEPEYPKGLRLFFIILALVLSIFLLSLDMTIVATAIPKITEEFQGLDKVGWYGSAFFLTNGGFQSTWGKIYKYFPLKPSFLIALLIFEIGSTICAAAPSSTALIIGRAIAGIGAAGLAAGAYTIVAFAAPPAKRPAYTGIIGAAYGMASVVGPLLGGAFTDLGKGGWRWCFWINLPVGGVSALIIFLFFNGPERDKEEDGKIGLREKFRQIDLGGVVLVMAASVCFLLGVQKGGIERPWDSAQVIGLLVGSFAIFALWATLQYFQGERSMIPPRMILSRINLVMVTFLFFFAGGFFIAIYYIPVYFQSVHGSSPTMSGVRNLPMIIAVSISTIVSGSLISRFGCYQPILLVGSCMATVGAGLLYTLDGESLTGQWIGYQIVIGVGLGLAFQIPMIVVQATTDGADIPSATGMILFFMGLGGAYLVSASQAAFVNQMTSYVLKVLPTIDKFTLIASPATQIRHTFSLAEQPVVIDGYTHGLQVVFAMCIACTGISTVVALGTKWERLDMGKASVGGMA